MTPEQLSEYMGEIDEELVANAHTGGVSRKRILLMVGSLAACAVVAFTGIMIATRQKPVLPAAPISGTVSEPLSNAETGIGTYGAVSELPHTEESEDKTVEMLDSEVYYVENGSLHSKTETHEAIPETLFGLWKEANHIGEEVRFISVRIDSNDFTEESGGVATYHVGDYFIYRLTITNNIEAYYTKVDKELLLESLKKTMLGEGVMEFDEYHLILQEE